MTFAERKLAWEATEHARKFFFKDGGWDNVNVGSIVQHHREGRVIAAAQALHAGEHYDQTGMDTNELAEARALADSM